MEEAGGLQGNAERGSTGAKHESEPPVMDGAGERGYVQGNAGRWEALRGQKEGHCAKKQVLGTRQERTSRSHGLQRPS